ncbi:hypothetical protein EMIHUDRAFT_211614 [Emiliania huxleyi CCMP1516]|uniref:Uncharacterized protein n=2 Tax=Emiliania huxleyi TaxID=2903 RepID=A0A0D3IVX6_EMIH1|nr:hypothetical protein EMIHUDRAFT_211614 [Emiliania huxleyi CCMP1516]EOD15411.1 hypothetical protein EMIHUDRAFT_211614 [Emiliania huxleyi CCMP1516]|eukprot:XP_005767840.1 hypothetical protein EMIHUDRAFT_211614 [Emiliania huxleyi CCMP1516]
MGRTLLESSFFARELNEGNWGWQVINGSCGKRRFKFGRGGFKRCFDLVIKMSFSSAQFSWRSWVITVRGNHVYDWVSGPRHRIDVSFRFHARGSAARVMPHGIIGQSFSSNEPRHGHVDSYPQDGEFITSAMAEGAIEGNATMYEMASPYATEFAFSRFSGVSDGPDKGSGSSVLDASEASTMLGERGSSAGVAGRFLSEEAPCPPPSSPPPLSPGAVQVAATSFSLDVGGGRLRRRALDAIGLDAIEAALIASFAGSGANITAEQITLEDLGDNTVLVTIVQAAVGPSADDITASALQPSFLASMSEELGTTVGITSVAQSTARTGVG